MGQSFCFLLVKIFVHFRKYRHQYHQTPTAYGIYNDDGSIKSDFAHSLNLFKEAESENHHFAFLKSYLNDNSIILDYGCGNGGRTIFYEKYYSSNVIGIDIDETAINIATMMKETLYSGAKIKFLKSSGNIPLGNNSIDLIFMNDVMEHVNDPVKALKDCYDALKNGGFLCINFNSYWSPAGHHLNDWIPIPWAHLFFSEKTLIAVLKKLSMEEPYIQYQFPNINKSITSFNELGASTLNYITLKIFLRYVNNSSFIIKRFILNGYEGRFRNPIIRTIFGRLKYMPLMKEFIGGRIICILIKPYGKS